MKHTNILTQCKVVGRKDSVVADRLLATRRTSDDGAVELDELVDAAQAERVPTLHLLRIAAARSVSLQYKQ